MLGQKPIVSMTENTNSAILCDVNYENLRDVCLESRNWSFAMKYVNGIEDPSRMTPSGDHSIIIAEDCIRIHRVFPIGGNESDYIRWYKAGNFIITTESTVDYKYISRVEDPNYFTPLFAESLSARIAAQLAIPLTENEKLADSMWRLYYLLLGQAASSDGMQGSNEVYRSNQLTGVRRS
jgi:hypothetical protein